MDTLRELTALADHRLGTPESIETAAARYAAQARLHERLSVQPGYDSARESRLASWAHERSLQLLRSRV